MAVGPASVAALPLALATAGLLLPGSPDEPNNKALIVGMFIALPAWAVAALIGLVLAMAVPGRRGDLVRALGPMVALATSVWLLLFAWPVAAATPPPETQEQRLLAQNDPHLWAAGAWRMAATAGVLAVVGLLLMRRAAVRSEPSGDIRRALDDLAVKTTPSEPLSIRRER